MIDNYINQRTNLVTMDAKLFYDLLAEVHEAGYKDGWRDRSFSILHARTAEEDMANKTPNPYLPNPFGGNDD